MDRAQSATEASALAPAQVVAVEAGNRIEDHLRRQARYNPTASLKALTTQLRQEYEDRFLIELIQNAYDAHPNGVHDGHVHVRLDESNDPPILYVANGGRPFEIKNFDALTNVAQSSKPPGEGIGNKGVGFRSVLQVCEYPEIYSIDPQDPTDAGFSGFCFGFATDDDIRRMVDGQADYDIIDRDFSRYLLPVPATPQDPYLQEMRHQGMVTVVRLPLADPQALDLARAQIQRLLEPTPPIAIFLERLSVITVDHVDGEGAVSAQWVERQVRHIAVDGFGPVLQWIDTSGSSYLTATRRLSGTDVRTVVLKAIEIGELDDSWADWTGDVEVSLAVEPRTDTRDEPVMYTYLPMRVGSPLRAHLHAPFHTKMARLALKEDSHFNDFLLRVAARVAAETVKVLVSGQAALDLPTRQKAVVDLLCWDRSHMELLTEALADAGFEIADSQIAPVHSGEDIERWASLRAARTWPIDDVQVLTVDTIATTAAILEPELGEARINRLSQVGRESLGLQLRPSDDEVATWVEQVAKTMQKAGLKRWNRFLTDLAHVFKGRSPEALQGRFILLDDQRRLRRAGPWRAGHAAKDHPTVFMPPLVGQASATVEEVDLSEVPKSLHRAFSFLHRDIRVRTRTGARWERSPVGELFKAADLVEQFELTAVLTHLERLLSGRVSDRTYSQALRWVFAQESASRSVVTDLRRLGLRVPTAKGWIEASRAVFSPGWGTSRSASLTALLNQAHDVSPSLIALREAMIRPPEDWPFKVRDVSAFRDFLVRCGVRDGLFPVPLRSASAIRMNGANFGPTAIARRFGFEPDPQWIDHVKQLESGHLEGPYTPYTGDQSLWVVPGQDEFANLSNRAKDRFAGALLEAAPHWPRSTLSYDWRRRSPHHSSKPDPQSWPSPARTFLERGAWFPMADAGRRDEHYFVRPQDAWTFDESSSETAPRFARLAPKEHRRRLADAPALVERLVAAGLRVWNSPRSARDRLVELGKLLLEGSASSGDALPIRRAAIRAWSDLAREQGVSLPPNTGVVVTRGSALTALAPSVDGVSRVYVLDEAPGLVARVLETTEMPLLAADPAHGATAAALLNEIPGLTVRQTSTVRAEVHLDGERVVPGASAGTRLLDLFGPWFGPMVLAVLDLRSTRFERITDRVLHETEAKLRTIRLKAGNTVELTVDGQSLAMGGRLGDALHLDDPDHPLLVVRNGGLELPSWRAVDVFADDLAALLNQPQAASEFRAAALALERRLQDWRQPTTRELADVLRCSQTSVEHLFQDLRTSTDHVRYLLEPFVMVLAGAAAVDRLEDGQAADIDALSALLQDFVGSEEATRLLDAASIAESVDDIRRRLGTDLGQLNEALASLRRPPLHFASEHRSALDAYLAAHRVELLTTLRARFVRRFNNHQDLGPYVIVRDFSALEPDPVWLHDREQPDDQQLGELIGSWLHKQGEEPAGPVKLPAIDDVRRANAELLDRELPELGRVVHAWVAKRARSVAPEWSDLQRLRDALAGSGCLDFHELDQVGLIHWLDALALWPAGMDTTSDLAALGLSVPDLERGSTSQSRADSERRLHRTSLTFGGKSYDTATEGLRDLTRAIDESIDEKFLRSRPALAELNVIPERRPDGRGGGSGGARTLGGRHRQQDPTNEQTKALGLIGELLAYRWLERAYPNHVTPDSWVSENRMPVLGGHQGNDSLGYDFRISRRSGTLLFEVKATSSDDFAFDISDKELAVARKARKGQYRIIHIRSVLSTSHRELTVLPNPLEAESAQLFEPINRGLRLRFLPRK